MEELWKSWDFEIRNPPTRRDSVAGQIHGTEPFESDYRAGFPFFCLDIVLGHVTSTCPDH